jgi:transitional endoplasmic reticulum ATPase
MADAVEKKTVEQEQQDQLLAKLAELGGQLVQSDELKFQGTEIILPKDMEVGDAILHLRNWKQAQEEDADFGRKFHYRPMDGAVAVHNALKRVFGSSGVPRPQWTFFGPMPLDTREVTVGYGQVTSIPWGTLTVPIFRGVMHLGTWRSPRFGEMFQLSITCQKRFQAHAAAIFTLVEEELREHSIYRGKAIDGDQTPNFIDLSTVDAERVIYSDEAQAQLEANIWSLMRRTQLMRDLKMPLKRAVLLHGPYGTGKTLAAFRTAQIATEFGWTFIYCRPGEDDLPTVLATAKLYTPACVFVEDLDAIEKKAAGDVDIVQMLLDAFDGITTKGSEVMMVLTTNHPERINKAMLRPGRLDAVVEIGSLDLPGVQRMIESMVPEDMRTPLDYLEIYAAMEGFLPAFVKEATDRAVRYALARADRHDIVLETQDFVQAAEGLKPQLRMMREAQEPKQPSNLETQLQGIVASAVDGTHGTDDDGEQLFELRSS